MTKSPLTLAAGDVGAGPARARCAVRDAVGSTLCVVG